MKDSFERAWVSLANSSRYRRFAKQGLGSRLFRTESYKKLLVAKNYVTTYRLSQSEKKQYEALRTFCIFIGPTKSGSTVTGSLLDAHENVILADEADALRYVAAGFSAYQIFQLLKRRSRRHAMVGRVTARRMQAYSFEVQSQWQGRSRDLRVIGDCKAGIATRRLAENPGLLERLRRVMNGVDVKFIQVVRNPFDPITAMMVRGNRSYTDAISGYFTNCDYLVELRKKINDSALEIVKYEDFIDRPEQNLSRLGSFLGVSIDDNYLNSCQNVLYDSPDKLRHRINWQRKWVEFVSEKLEEYEFLRGYTFEN